MKVLFTGCIFDDKKINELKEQGIEVIPGKTNYTEEELINVLMDYDCYINGGDEKCTRNVIENNKHLKLISYRGTGYQQYIDIDAAKECGIPVSYAPGANAKTVAEYTVALVLDAVKKITYSNNEIKNNNWNKYKTFNLEGKTLGIVGMGAIGKHVTKILCDGFGMNVIYVDLSPIEDINNKYNTNMVSLNELFKKSDIVVISATCTKDNVNMITSEQFNMAKDDLIIVNTARAKLINKDDLYDAIINNKIGFVAMDGFYDEPIKYDDEFLKLPYDKFLITPHNAYNSFEAVEEMEKMLIESLLDVINNQEIRNIVK